MIGDLFDSPWKILIVAVVIIVLFGSKKLPQAARSLGQSMRILKREVGDLYEDDPESSGSGAPENLQTSAELTGGLPGQQAQIDSLQQQVRDLQRAAAMDPVPTAPSASTVQAGASAESQRTNQSR